MPLEIWTDESGGVERAALTDGRRLLDLAVAPVARADQPGAVYMARVTKQDAAGAFITCMPSDAPEFSAWCEKIPASASGHFPVQITQPARRTSFSDKPAHATLDITLPGWLLLYHPAGKGVAFSRRHKSAPSARKELAAIMQALELPGGWTLRARAAIASHEALLAEAKILAQIWRENSAKKQQTLWDAPSAAQRLLLQTPAPPAAIIAASEALRKKLARSFAGMASYWQGELTCDPDRQSVPLFERADFESMIETLRAPLALLKNSGNLIIQATEALTVIDVNPGQMASKGSQTERQDILLEIMRQIRLRNIGGMIMIDMPGGQGSQRRGDMLDNLRKMAEDDPVTVDIFGITRLGLIEMARKRQGWNLSEAFSA